MLEFCASAVAAINEAVIQNREVLTNTFLIIVLLLLFVGLTHFFRLLPANEHHPMEGKVTSEQAPDNGVNAAP